MAAPNIVNVATITGITTFIAGINTGGTGVAQPINTSGVTTIVSNAASSGKVLKINSLVAAGVGDTTGVTVDIYDKATATGAAAETPHLSSSNFDSSDASKTDKLDSSSTIFSKSAILFLLIIKMFCACCAYIYLSLLYKNVLD